MSEATDRSNPSRVPGLDLLRLVAVAAVVLYHYGFWGPASNGVPQVALPYLASYAQYGFLGVPIFFTISGFVIAYSAEGRTAGEFAIARFSRIYPAFVVCMTITFLTTISIGAPRFTACRTSSAPSLCPIRMTFENRGSATRFLAPAIASAMKSSIVVEGMSTF